MLKNYLTIAIRNLYRNKSYTLINVMGLAIGMTCCLLIYLFIQNELSYDTSHQDANRIYRVTYHAMNGNDYARIPPTISPLMGNFFPEVETSARVFSGNQNVQIPGTIVGQVDRSLEEENILFVDPTFTDIFRLVYQAGDIGQALTTPFTALLSQETARKYFGQTDPIGRVFKVEGMPFTVIGVVQNFPPNAHMHFSMLLPYDNMFDVQGEPTGSRMRENLSQNWFISHSYTYIKLKEGALPTGVDQRFPDLISTHTPERLQVGQRFSLMPILDIHLYSNVFLDPEPQGDIQYIYIFGGIAFATLLLACFNFINLSTAQAMKRTVEIGLRKTMGAHSTQLFQQFLGETLVICLLALPITLMLTISGLPILNDLTLKSLTITSLLNGVVITGFLGIFLLTGFLAGSYPAFSISRLKVITSLKNKQGEQGVRTFPLRKVLMVFQFVVSISLVAGTILIFNQLNYLVGRPMGFQSEGVLGIPLYSPNMNNYFKGVDGNLRSTLNTFEETIASHPNVLGSTLSRNVLGLNAVGRRVIPEGYPSDKNLFVPALAVDYDFIDFYGLDILHGRTFDKAMGTDHLNAFVINETAVREFGWVSSSEAIGKTINLESKEGTVVGVAKDFNFISLRNPIGAMLMEVHVPAFAMISIRISNADLNTTLGYLETQWGTFFPDRAFEYSFLDNRLEDQYRGERRLGGILQAFAFLAILVSCLGAYGLVTFNAEQRRKEIGVRKVLGASFSSIIVLLYREFTWLFGIGLVLAIPIIYYGSVWWLENFPYRTGIDLELFIASGLIMLAITWATISYQSIRAARVNPIKCLRDE